MLERRRTSGQGFGLVLPHSLTFHAMGLDCIPKHDRRTKTKTIVPNGFTHPENEPCPFDADNAPRGVLGTCCSLRGKVAAHELEALGEDNLAERMYKDMTATEAVTFAQELDAAVHRLEETYAPAATKPKGAGWNGTRDPETGEINWGMHSSFEEAIAAIRTAARWYEKVGRLGFGVRAWY